MAALPRCTEGTWKRGVQPRVSAREAYPRHAEHNTPRKEGIEERPPAQTYRSPHSSVAFSYPPEPSGSVAAMASKASWVIAMRITASPLVVEVAVSGASGGVGMAGRLKLPHKLGVREDVGRREARIITVSRLPRHVAQTSLFQFPDQLVFGVHRRIAPPPLPGGGPSGAGLALGPPRPLASPFPFLAL